MDTVYYDLHEDLPKVELTAVHIDAIQSSYVPGLKEYVPQNHKQTWSFNHNSYQFTHKQLPSTYHHDEELVFLPAATRGMCFWSLVFLRLTA